MLRGYSSPFNLGHKALKDFWNGTIYVQEKIDGSQFSFGVVDGELKCRSRKREVYTTANDMFEKAVKTAKSLFDEGLLNEGWNYRCEYLMRPKHNTLAYERTPKNYLALFDIDIGDQDYLTPVDLEKVAEELDLEVTPLLAIWTDKPSMGEVMDLLELQSFLGGPKIEGIVMKNYSLFGGDSKVLMAKFVSEDFREKHKSRKPKGSIVDKIISEYQTEARWNKARQHLREAGELQDAPQDIPLLFKEVSQDVYKECADEIKEKLFKYFWKDINRGITRGLPEWYKKTLAEESLLEEE